MTKYFLTIALNLSCLVGFSQGYFIEFKITSSSEKAKGFAGTVVAYAQDGNSRSESKFNVSDNPAVASIMGNMSSVHLTLQKTPGITYVLNDKDKTYVELKHDMDEEYKDYPKTEYEVTLIGKEKVNGFNTTHVKVKAKNGKYETEMWTSKDIGDYKSYAAIKTKYTGRSNMWNALAEKDADGMVVRMKGGAGNSQFQMDLVTAEKRNNPSSLFDLSGYTKTSSLDMGQGAVKDMIKNIQNMTPEEREQYIQNLKNMYSPK